MLFNSNVFIIFIIAVTLSYYSLPLFYRRYFLLIASYFFYAWWSVTYSLLLVISTVVDYTASRIISETHSQATKKVALLASLFSNLGILFFFKYADFLSTSMASVTGMQPWPVLDLILPLGISFYTFQTMSYTIDVYRGKIKAFKDPVDVALYVSFFPQLVAGPIIRADVLIPQLHTAHKLDPVMLRAGIGLILWGLSKKVFLADSMAPIVNEAYAEPAIMSGLALGIATYAFAGQIYFDFSGYTDIAIGCALLLGVKLPKNFNAPYFSLSIREFWRRWHISLSTWLRDYLYISLGGNRKGEMHTYANLIFTMVLGGLWHGAGWNWAVWGLFHGGILALERFLNIPEEAGPNPFIRFIRWAVTFHLVCISWILFRASDLSSAWLIMKRIVMFEDGVTFSIWAPLIVMALLLFTQYFKLREKWIKSFKKSESLALVAVILAIVIFPIAYNQAENVEFIYFQF